jgi:hypothetical protein
MTYMNRLLLLVFFISVLSSCGEEKMTSEEISKIGITSCRTLAPFIKDLGFDMSRSGLSTTEPSVMGVVLIQYPKKSADSADKKIYQDRSWSQYGWMGTITSDLDGNNYTAPFPRESTYGRSLSEINKIYKVNGDTGNMAVLTELPRADSVAGVYPFGVLDLYYDCHGQKLYASSVAGSTPEKEKGVIYVVDPENGDVVDKLEGHDVSAVFVGGITGQKRLFFGSARSSDVYSVELTKEGKFKGDVRKEFSIEKLGETRSDKARRIHFNEDGNIMIFASEFSYTPGIEKEEEQALYRFAYDKSTKKWIVLQGRSRRK